ncbi:MAG: TlpA disulfide reductase family protein [Pyrinomonadaceae bacterium]
MKTIKILSFALSILFALSISATAQSIIFASLEGDKIDVEAQKGKVVVMAIGASWLPLSNDQADTINKLAKRYEGQDVVLYFIATDSASEKSKNYASDDDIRKFVKRNKLNVTILRDSDGKASVQRYKLDQLPAFILLDKTGKPDGDAISGIDPLDEIDTAEILSKRIDKLL